MERPHPRNDLRAQAAQTSAILAAFPTATMNQATAP
jgi:hypothetical protein